MNYSIIKKSIFLFVFFGCLLLSGKAFASTDVSGIISQNTTWDKAGSPYIVKGNILVDTGATLNITEGVSVLFNGEYYLQVRGKINVQGTKEEMVYFDTNNASKWDKIELIGNNNHLFEYCNIQNSKQAIYGCTSSSIISNCTFRKNDYAIYFQQSNDNTIIGCQFYENKTGVYLNTSNSNIIRDCMFKDMDCGIFLMGYFFNYGSKTCSNNQIIKCTVDNCGNGIYGTTSTSVPRTSNNQIVECAIINNNLAGICFLGFGTGETVQNNCITNCNIRNNTIGISLNQHNTNQIQKCNIVGNKTIGIKGVGIIEFNNIYNNSDYNLKSIYGVEEYGVPNNYWGVTDKLKIGDAIFDFYDDFNLCKVIFEPYLLIPYVDPTGATLEEIKINNTNISEFSPLTESYIIELPYGTTVVPIVTATPTNPNANVIVTSANTLPGTTTIMITTEDGKTTKTYTINFTVANAAPTASNVTITGTAQVGQILHGSYQYSDAENDPEGVSTLQWYRSDNVDGTGKASITGATSRDYILVAADQDKYLFFEVTPKANTGTLNSISVLSSASSKVGSVTTNSTALTIAQITVINNPAGTTDTVNVIGLQSGDEVRVFNSLTNQTLLGTGIVQEGQTTVKLIIQQLGIEAGTIYVSVQNPGKNESVRTPKEYIAENGHPVDECFIATAAFGSKFTWPVALLRQFRDQYLLTNSWGTVFVKFYYQHSPSIAAMIATSQPLKMLVRALLAPAIAIVYFMYHPLLLAIILIMFVFIFYLARLRKRYI